jgi:hypothetical protein
VDRFAHASAALFAFLPQTHMLMSRTDMYSLPSSIVYRTVAPSENSSNGILCTSLLWVDAAICVYPNNLDILKSRQSAAVLKTTSCCGFDCSVGPALTVRRRANYKHMAFGGFKISVAAHGKPSVWLAAALACICCDI